MSAEFRQTSRRESLGNVIQAAGIVIVSVGIAIEIWFGANAGFVCLTAGSLGFAIGTKLKGR